MKTVGDIVRDNVMEVIKASLPPSMPGMQVYPEVFEGKRELPCVVVSVSEVEKMLPMDTTWEVFGSIDIVAQLDDDDEADKNARLAERYIQELLDPLGPNGFTGLADDDLFLHDIETTPGGEAVQDRHGLFSLEFQVVVTECA